MYALRRMAALYPEQVGEVLKSGMERETNLNVKRALGAALLVVTQPARPGPQHTKLDPPVKATKPEAGFEIQKPPAR